MEAQTKKTSAREMHKIIWMLVGVFGLIAVSYPIAMFRVSDMEKFRGFHVKSLTIEGQQPKQPSTVKK